MASKLEKGAKKEGQPRVGGPVAQEIKAIPCHFSQLQTLGVGRTHRDLEVKPCSALGGIARERPKGQEFGFPLGFWMGLQRFQLLDEGRR